MATNNQPANQSNENVVNMLKSMFHDNRDLLTQSTLKAVVNLNQGDLDKCVDQILDLVNDPLADERQEALRREKDRLMEVIAAQEKKQNEIELMIQKTSPTGSPEGSGHRRQSWAEVAQKPAATSGSGSNKNKKSNPSSPRPAVPQASSVTLKESSKEAETKKLLEQDRALFSDFQERSKEEQSRLSAQIATLEKERQERNQKLLIQVETLKKKLAAAEFSQVANKVMERVAEQQNHRENSDSLGSVTTAATSTSATATVASTWTNANSSVEIELKVSETVALPGAKVVVEWKYTKGVPTPTDWIGYYKKSRPIDSRDYYTLQKTGGNVVGAVTFTLPSKLGICEFRFFQNNSYVVAGRSKEILVGPNVTLSARIEGTIIVTTRKVVQGPVSSWDWVALYPKTETDAKRYLPDSSAYLNTNDACTVTLPCPKTPGEYIVRFYSSGSGWSPLAESQVIVVEDEDSVMATPSEVLPGEDVECVFSIKSIDPNPRHWIALFACTEPLDSQNRIGSYQYVGDRNRHTFAAPLIEGEYEFRFYPRGSYKVLKRSNKFRVKKN